LYLLNLTMMVTQYLRQAFWPRVLVVNYGFPQPLTLGEVAPRFGGTALLTIAAIACGVRTMARNRDYTSAVSVLRAAVEGWPTAENEVLLAKLLLISGAHEEGIAQLRAALPLAPGAHYNLGVELLNDGKIDEGLTHLQTAIAFTCRRSRAMARRSAVSESP
jgi:hypothetical protein